MIRITLSRTSQEYIWRINSKNNNERTPLKSIKNSERRWTKLLPKKKKKMNKTLTNSRSIFLDNSSSESILCFCTSCHFPSLSWHSQWRVTLIMYILTVRFSSSRYKLIPLHHQYFQVPKIFTFFLSAITGNFIGFSWLWELGFTTRAEFLILMNHQNALFYYLTDVNV